MFKFSIRELLLLTVIVGLGAAWGADHYRQYEQIVALKGRTTSGLIALEWILTRDGWQIAWQPNNVRVQKGSLAHFVPLNEDARRNLAMRYSVEPSPDQLGGFMKFTIRDLLWLTVVVALAVGWWVHQHRLNSGYRASVPVLAR